MKTYSPIILPKRIRLLISAIDHSQTLTTVHSTPIDEKMSSVLVSGHVELARRLWVDTAYCASGLTYREFTERLDKDQKYREFSQYYLNSIGEMLNNAFEHGNKYDPTKQVTFSIWWTLSGVILACRDEGDFYAKEETAWLIREREIPKSTSTRASSCNAGIDCIYEGDHVEVLWDQNTIVAVFLYGK